jgi:CDP-diacylglycerol--serine O-phosphatidyltransferase
MEGPRNSEPGANGTVKKIAILPTLLTLGNGVCGFASIAYASKISAHDPQLIDFYFVLSAFLILFAMVFDALDGYVARLSKSASDFGGQLDSLCDAVSFGAAPAFLLLRLGMEWQDPSIRKAVSIVAALYMVCAILRLARFNVENSPDPASHKRFKGLPSPAAAGCVASLAILRSLDWGGLNRDAVHSFVHIVAPVGTLLVALLMVSRVSYPHFTKQLHRRRLPFGVVVQAILFLCLIALRPDLGFFVLFWGYALNGLVRSTLVRALRHDASPRQAESIDG